MEKKRNCPLNLCTFPFSPWNFLSFQCYSCRDQHWCILTLSSLNVPKFWTRLLWSLGVKIKEISKQLIDKTLFSEVNYLSPVNALSISLFSRSIYRKKLVLPAFSMSRWSYMVVEGWWRVRSSQPAGD